MHVKPAQNCMGCSLLVGVEIAALATLVVDVLLIAVCSSTEPLRITELVIPPEAQVIAASWAFVGIPSAVVAGVGVLHRIEEAVRLFFFYSCVSFVLSFIIPVWLVSTGNLCDMFVHPDLQSQGTAFVCGFANTFVFTWGLMLTMVQMYMLYVIWSAAEDIGQNPYPELNRYEEAMRSANLPPIGEESGPTPAMLAKAALGEPKQQYMGGGENEAFGQRGQVSALLSAAAAAGQDYQFGHADDEAGAPQSFVPSPPPGARFSSTMPRSP